MKDFKGDPGRWYIDPNMKPENEICIESTHEASVLATLFCDPMDDETRATAKLMAASKDMAEALQELLRFHHVMTDAADNLQYPDNFLKAIESAKAALSKALD